MPNENKSTCLSLQNKPGVSFARVISMVLHPLIMGPLTFFVITVNVLDSGGRVLSTMLLAIIATSFIPLLTVIWMLTHNRSRHIDIPEKEKRTAPFLIAVAGYFAVAFIYFYSDQPPVITAMMAIYGINTTIAAVITSYWKISIHGMAIGGPLGGFFYLFGNSVLWGWLALPLIAFSRVCLKAHTISQVIAGFSLGFFLTYIQLFLYLN